MTSTALVMPTIHVPRATLQAFRAGAPDVLFLLVGSPRSPHAALAALAAELAPARYLTPQTVAYPHARHYLPNTTGHRNLGFLEALRLGADVIVAVDDDNAPRDPDRYWADVARLLAPAPPVYDPGPWWNVGWTADAPYRARGLPLGQWGAVPPEPPSGGTGNPRPLGVLQGVVYGDPDLSAVERLCHAPRVVRHWPPRLVALDPAQTWHPLNSQNTVWRRETLPLAALWLFQAVGRYDDIWAGYFAQRVLAACGYLVGVGAPATLQTRNRHNLLKDLDEERHGMEYTDAFCAWLRTVPLPAGRPVLDTAAALVAALPEADPAWRVPVAFLWDWLADAARVSARAVAV